MTDEELNKKIASVFAGFDRLDKAQAKTDVQLAKTDRQIAKTDAQIAETSAEVRQLSQEMRNHKHELLLLQSKTDAQIAKTDKQLAETDKQIAKTSAEVSKLSQEIRNHIGNDGQSTEEYFYRTLQRNKQLGDVHYDEIGRQIKMSENSPEFDVVLYNGDTIAIVEIKKKAHPNDMREMAKKQVSAFKQLFPHYANFTFYFAVATMVSNDALLQVAQEEGIFLITQQGENLAYLNDKVNAF